MKVEPGTRIRTPTANDEPDSEEAVFLINLTISDRLQPTNDTVTARGNAPYRIRNAMKFTIRNANANAYNGSI